MSIKRIGTEKPIPALERVMELYSYCPETGQLRRRIARGNQKAGALVGNSHGDHIQIMMDNELYNAHQVIWLMMTGSWPKEEIDHKDLDGRNNRWGNLREATHGQNMANREVSKSSSTGFKGVSLRKRCPQRPYIARISPAGKTIHLGYFSTPEEANAAYMAAAQKHFGEFAR